MAPATPQAAIRIDDVSLRYRLARQHVGSIKEYFIHLLSGSLTYEDLWALKDVELAIDAGERVGVIGPNGAGKTTLAKVIAGVLKPTRGKCRVEGVIAPLLELGTGFDYELTGFENIYLNALLLGRRKREVTEKMDAIVDFSGLEQFIHTPIRNYSSGMVARLGFAIATAWIPDVLILDEVLAVGDVRFLDRCHKRLDDFRAAGTTLVLISHSSRTVLDYCHRCLWLESGVVMADGDAADVMARYEEAMHVDAPDAGPADEPDAEPVDGEPAENGSASDATIARAADSAVLAKP